MGAEREMGSAIRNEGAWSEMEKQGQKLEGYIERQVALSEMEDMVAWREMGGGHSQKESAEGTWTAHFLQCSQG